MREDDVCGAVRDHGAERAESVGKMAVRQHSTECAGKVRLTAVWFDGAECDGNVSVTVLTAVRVVSVHSANHA